MRRADLPYRLIGRAGQGLVVLCAGYLLLGSVCFAAGDASGPTPGAPVADHATETLLRTIVQQISGGRIISPPEDNAMQTWQLVLHRDIATQRSPEVLKALEDFDTYARLRAADEKAAGRVLVAAELTVFADQASRMMGRIPPVDAPGTVASAPDAARNDTVPGQSGDGASAPATDAASRAQSTTAADVPAAAIGGTSTDPPAGSLPSTAEAATNASAAVETATNAASGEIPHAGSVGGAASTTEVAADTVPSGQSTGGIAAVTDAVMHIVPPTRALGTTAAAADTTGSDERPTRPADNAGSATDGAGNAVAHAISSDSAASAPAPVAAGAPQAASADTAMSAQSVGNGEAPQAPAASVGAPPTARVSGDAARTKSADAAASAQMVATGEAPSAGVGPTTTPAASGDAATAQSSGTTAAASGGVAHDGVPFDGLAGQLRAPAPGSEAGGTSVTAMPTAAVPVVSGVATHVARPTPGSDHNQPAATAARPAAPEPAMAAFYAARGDAMLAQKDISAARKFYEYAANAGSVRAAIALARTYDPAFAVQLGEVGLQSNPDLAATWYRKAAELGGKPAQLSQSGGAGK